MAHQMFNLEDFITDSIVTRALILHQYLVKKNPGQTKLSYDCVRFG